ncbi:MAG: hypothetical protein J0H49_12125 [Acidobacteria bacterium]|nr:hypothetical protein [Acidobacteriota bacterium]
MSVNAINSSLSANSLESILKTRTSNPSGTSGVSSDPPARVSKLGSLMARLSELQQSDPDRFKEAASTIADKLKEAAASASESGDSEKATKLTELAQKFSSAAETGSMPDLRPPGGMKGHGGPHPGGGPPPGPPPTDSSTSSTNSTDEDDSSSTDSTDSTDSATNTVLESYKEMLALMETQAGNNPMSKLTDVLESVLSDQSA